MRLDSTPWRFQLPLTGSLPIRLGGWRLPSSSAGREPHAGGFRLNSMRLGYAAVVSVVIAVTGCADASSEPTSAGEVPPVAVVSASSVEAEDGDASELVLTVFEVCYSICSPTYAMPKFGVYGDGSLVVIDRADLQDPTSPYRARSFILSTEDSEWMWELISEGGLTGGGAHAAGTREGVADGGGLVFETSEVRSLTCTPRSWTNQTMGPGAPSTTW